jgi:dihydrofolate reductase
MGAPTALVARLGAEGAKRIYVDGGSVITQFLAERLMSDVTVSVVPILLGDGIRLLQALPGDVRLQLIESRAFESGLVQLEYRVRDSPFGVGVGA